MPSANLGLSAFAYMPPACVAFVSARAEVKKSSWKVECRRLPCSGVIALVGLGIIGLRVLEV